MDEHKNTDTTVSEAYLMDCELHHWIHELEQESSIYANTILILLEAAEGYNQEYFALIARNYWEEWKHLIERQIPGVRFSFGSKDRYNFSFDTGLMVKGPNVEKKDFIMKMKDILFDFEEMIKPKAQWAEIREGSKRAVRESMRPDRPPIFGPIPWGSYE